jgi:biotin carboxylase
LESAKIEGVPTTVPLHRKILAHEDFRAARCDTLWLGRERDAGRL